nr:MAG TPA: hypothetical protein [Caudoviricetes sp.]
MVTDEEFERLVSRLLETLAPMLGVELEETAECELKGAEIRDKDGVIYNLNDFVSHHCVIDDGKVTHMSVQGDYTVGNYWVSNNASRHDSEGLAKLIRRRSYGGWHKVTVYEF